MLGSSTIIADNIKGVFSLRLVLEPGGSEEVTRLDTEFLPEEQEEDTFATLTLKSKTGETCPAAFEKGKIKGAIFCYWLEPMEEDKMEHLNQCTEQDLKRAN